jgi:dienelactone hydrolase
VTWGVSAGGQLAALAALDPAHRIAAAVCWYSPADLDALAADIEDAGGTGDRSAGSREGQLIGAALDERPDLVAAASPIRHVRAGAPPPFLLLHGDADRAVPHRQSQRFAEALVAAGGRLTGTSGMRPLRGFCWKVARAGLQECPPRSSVALPICHSAEREPADLAADAGSTHSSSHTGAQPAG